MSSLDELLSALQEPVPSKAGSPGTPAKSKPIATDDLDSLLEGLAAPIGQSSGTKSSENASDDLDDLLNNLSGTSKPAAAAPKKVAAAPAKPSANDDLDDLLNGLANPVPVSSPKKVAAKVTAAPAKPAAHDDLDSLLDDLAGGPTPAKVTSPVVAKVTSPVVAKVTSPVVAAKKVAGPPPANGGSGSPAGTKKVAAVVVTSPGPAKVSVGGPAKAPAAKPVDDLDSLLGELSGDSSKKVAAPPKPVEDLDSLMTDLGGSSVKAKPAFAVNNNSKPVSKRDDLDDLMASLDSRPAPSSPAVAKATGGRAGSNQDKVDELDSLMSSLGGSSSPALKPQQANKDDLDDLMNSLGGPVSSNSPTIRPAHPSGTVPSRPHAGSRFEDLVTTITQDMNDLGTETSGKSRGVCYHCRQPIYDECMQALGRTYHPEHFMCSSCNNPLGTGNFFELAGTPHCQRCYQIQFCPKCAHCNQAIADRCVTALDKKWHVNCFVCTQCTSPFSGNFFERDGRPYCDKCFHQVFAPRCRSCNLPVLGDCVNALGAQWHPDHFNCQFCRKVFTGTFFEYEGMPYCEAHYYQKMGSSCSGCQQPISGACVDALGKKWHPEHFVCAFCMNKLEGTAYSEKNTKPYCRGCFGKLFGA